MRLFVLVLITGTLFACGRLSNTFERLKPGSTTEVTFVQPRVQNEQGEILAAATLIGGVMVYAVNVDEPFRRGGRRLGDENTQISWVIPTAKYVFFGVGYQAAALSTGSPMHCGQTPPIQLDGSPKTIQIVLDQNNCGTPPFSAPGMNSGNQPQGVYVAGCSNNAANPTVGSACTPSSWGTMSVKISLPEYQAFNGELFVENGPGNDIESGCASPLASGTPLTTSVKIPTGAAPPGDPFVVGFNTFDAAGCSGYTIQRLYGLGRSLSNFNNPGLSKFEVNHSPFGGWPINPVFLGSTGSNIVVYLRDL